MKNLNFIKGIILGIAKIIPGLSGAVLMMSFHLYDRAIHAITHFFSDTKGNFNFLLELGFGILIGIVFFSKVVVFCLSHYYLYTSIFFVGLILGGFPHLIREISHQYKNIILMILSFLFISFISISHVRGEYLLHGNAVDFLVFVFAGFLEAIGTVLPGVSSTALLMLVGVYSYYITTISHLFSISLFQENFKFLFPFSLGLIIGIVVISLVVDYLFHHYKEGTFSIILGFSLSSILLLIVKIIPYFHNVMDIFICLILFAFGYFITRYI